MQYTLAHVALRHEVQYAVRRRGGRLADPACDHPRVRHRGEPDHYITHVDLSRRYGRTQIARYPDYVGKGGDFDFDAYRARFIAGASELDPAKSTLYLGYHLRVAYLLDKKHRTLDDIFAIPSREVELDGWLRALPTSDARHRP